MRYIQNILTKYKVQQEFMADYEYIKSKFGGGWTQEYLMVQHWLDRTGGQESSIMPCLLDRYSTGGSLEVSLVYDIKQTWAKPGAALQTP